MKERPIIFSGEMVRALLEGRKTQTRRIIKPQPLGYTGRKYIVPDDSPKAWHDSDDFLSFCPYGQPGDRLWVRETWFCHQNHGLDYSAVSGKYMNIFYRATDPDENFWVTDPESGERVIEGPGFRWRPSIHMPRWASRITLEVTGVRVERLQDISESDALAEGIEHDHPHRAYFASEQGGPAFDTAASAFRHLWETINGEDAWDANPWVWVVEFRRVEP